MSSENNRTVSESENTCVVCFKTVEYFSIGICDHPVCFECSTRMRVLCKQNVCPICRGDQPKVVFTNQIEPYSTLKPRVDRTNLQDVKYGFYFCSATIQKAYYSLLELNCQICDRIERRWPFKTFNQLKDHMRREHELFYCELCVENLKIFTFERKCYTRSELAQHRRKGDADNTSHRGHPLCEFCETRYMDSDELFRHLRRDHLYCHFCDADGKHQYYSTYDDLRTHFLEEHYLCEEGDCKNEQFTSVFRSDIDLKAHFASVHSKHLSRAANKQARTLEVEFNFAPRRNELPGQRGGRRQPNSSRHNERERHVEPEGASGFDNYYMEPGGPVQQQQQHQPPEKLFVNPLRGANFPTLGNNTGDSSASLSGGSRASVTFTSKFTPSFSGDEFPTLSGAPAPKSAATTQKSKKSEDFPTLGTPRDVIMTKKSTTTTSGVVQRNNHYRTLDQRAKSNSGGGTSVKLTVNQERPQSSSGPNVSIHVNHKPNGAVTTRISTASPPTSTIQVRPKTMEAFPALGPSSTPAMKQQPTQQWVQPKQKKYVEPKAMKVAPAPLLPPTDLSAFPTLAKKSEQKANKTSSVQMPVNSNWVNLNNLEKGVKTSKSNVNVNEVKKEVNNKSKKKVDVKSPQNKLEVKSQIVTKSEVKSIKSDKSLAEATNESHFDNKFVDAINVDKNKKKKKNVENLNKSALANETNNTKNKSETNGIVKKYSTLQIGTLELSEPATFEGFVDGFPALGNKPPPPPGLTKNTQPPGLSIKPPPGFNNFNATKATNNDLTFTNSAGQSYSILPTHQYYQPPNFTNRNANLIQNFFNVLKTSESMHEFKSYSDLFRNGGYPAEKYYEHCELVLKGEFDTIFPELMVLLPDIAKQGDLYNIYKRKCNKKKALDECATCKQVIFIRDIKQHLNNHYMENHFPSLGLGALETTNVWKK